jgi:cytochrome bd ubiquinol oxidase subunit II
MTDVLLGGIILWGFVFIYAIMGTMDFGAGFWSMVYFNREKTRATNIANRYLSPTWEVTNTFIVGLVIALYALFPGTAYTLGTVLFIPGSIILLLLSLRSAFLVFSHVATDFSKILTFISGITGLLIPVLLISVLPITHGNYITGNTGNPTLNLAKFFTSPHVYAFFGFAIFSTLFLSSLLLSDYSKESNEIEAFKIYRRNAMIVGPISLIMAFLILLTMKNEANWIYTNLINEYPLLVLSLVFFIISGIALYFPFFSRKEIKGMPRLAVVSIVIQYLVAFIAYARAHAPYMVYPIITLKSGFTDPNSFHAVFVTYIVGFIILFPGFFLFWRMFMKDTKYLRENR